MVWPMMRRGRDCGKSRTATERSFQHVAKLSEDSLTVALNVKLDHHSVP